MKLLSWFYCTAYGALRSAQFRRQRRQRSRYRFRGICKRSLRQHLLQPMEQVLPYNGYHLREREADIRVWGRISQS